MLDIKFIKENPKLVQDSAKNKRIEIDIDHVLEIYERTKEKQIIVQILREDRNKFAKEKNIEKGKELKEELQKEEAALAALEQELSDWMYKIPNPARKDVKIGKDE